MLLTTLPVLLLRWIYPPFSMVIQDWELQSDREAQQIWRPLEKISPNLQIAVIASEDQKFPNHIEFDLQARQLGGTRYLKSL